MSGVARNVYRGGGKASMPRLSFDYTDYTPTGLGRHSGKELRKEYTRLRDIAQKRIKRIQASHEFDQSEVLRYNADHYPVLKEVKSDRELSFLLTDLVNFLTAKRGSLQGLRDTKKAALKTLHESGNAALKAITAKDYSAWGYFMGFARAFAGDHMFDSNRTAELFNWAKREKVSPGSLRKNFAYYMQNFDKPDVKVKTRSRGGFNPEKWEGVFKREGR